MKRSIVILATVVYSAVAAAQQPPEDPFLTVYRQSCSVCHGENLEGGAQGTPLVGVELKHGSSTAEIAASISRGFPQTGMPAWSETLDDAEIQRAAIFIGEKRAALAYTDFKMAAPPIVPEGIIESEEHRFRVVQVIAGLDSMPYSIAPLPDGRILQIGRAHV